MFRSIVFAFCFGLSSLATAEIHLEDKLHLTYRFENALTGENVQQTKEFDLSSYLVPGETTVSDPILHKSLFLLRVANLIDSSLQQQAIHPAEHGCPCGRHVRREKRRYAVEGLKSLLESWDAHLASFEADAKIEQLKQRLVKLVQNMEDHNSGKYIEELRSRRITLLKDMAMESLNVTSGGAQDSGSFFFQVEKGLVPSPGAFTIEGFLSEFDLSLKSPEVCDSLICVEPAVAVDSAKKKLYVQVAMNSNLTELKRRPLNLSVVLDISGSMSAHDGTEKSRLEWAKDALNKILDELNQDDRLSIVLFDDRSEIFLQPSMVTNKEKIRRLVAQITTRGATNLEAGMNDGYNLVALHLDPKMENRMVLLSDAGLNTGITDDASLMKLMADHAAMGIGLTAIGMGENFNQHLIHAITQSKGGNYLFAQSGKEVDGFADKFDYLVTPVAFNFKASIDATKIPATFVRAYGVPTTPSAAVREVVDVRTLFLVGSGEGGAIILEYDLKG